MVISHAKGPEKILSKNKQTLLSAIVQIYEKGEIMTKKSDTVRM